jgi:hypothetical protein
MITRRRIGSLVLTAVCIPAPLAIFSLSAAQASATSATSASNTGSTAARTAPACVNRTVYNTPEGFDVFLQNKCGGDMSVKVIVNNGGDSPCYVMSRNTVKTFIYRGTFGSYDKTVLC